MRVPENYNAESLKMAGDNHYPPPSANDYGEKRYKHHTNLSDDRSVEEVKVEGWCCEQFAFLGERVYHVMKYVS